MRIIANEIYSNYLNAKQNAIIADEELPEISSAEMEIVRNMGDVPYEVAVQNKADAEFQCVEKSRNVQSKITQNAENLR